MQELTGLDLITTIGGNLRIKGNSSLKNLLGLSNLVSINGSLIINNNELEDLNGLNNINPESMFALNIYENDSLSYCNLNNICSYITNNFSSCTIYDNYSNCIDEVALVYSCDSCACFPGGFTNQSVIDNFPG